MHPPAFPKRADVEAVFNYLGFDHSKHEQERTLVQFALALGYLMIHSQSSRSSSSTNEIFSKLRESRYPPSAGELADLFATESQYGYTALRQSAEALMTTWPEDWNEPGQKREREKWLQDLQACFTLLIEVARLQGAKDSLSSIAAARENTIGRDLFWREVALIFQNKTVTTKTHELVAQAARHHLKYVFKEPDVSDRHYLVVTTNYDCLIEQALEELGENKWVVIYKKPWDNVSARFSLPLLEKYPGLPRRHEQKSAKNFKLDVDEPIVVIFKIHGSLFHDYDFSKDSSVNDSIVITDFDYEDYITGMGEKADLAVPMAAKSLMHGRSFLFLGYSLTDWNIRIILTAIIKKRAEGQTAPDNAVMKDVSRSAEVYCERRKIRILRTSLDLFAEKCQVPK